MKESLDWTFSWFFCPLPLRVRQSKAPLRRGKRGRRRERDENGVDGAHGKEGKGEGEREGRKEKVRKRDIRNKGSYLPT